MNVAVVGCGYWGSKHVRVLSGLIDPADVVMVDARPQRLAKLAESYPRAQRVTAIDDDLLERLDAAVIATPPKSHAALAVRLMDHGVHVLVEKPLATSIAEAQRMLDAAERNGVQLAVGHTFEHNATVWALRDLVDDGTLGKIHYIDTARLNLGLYQRDCNVLWDLAPHDISIANYLIGTRPDSVIAHGDSHVEHHSQEDVAYLRMRYEEAGVTVNVHASWLDPCKVRRVTVVGSEKMAVYNDMKSEEPLRIYDKSVVVPDDADDMSQAPTNYRVGGILSPNVPSSEPLLVQDRSFLEAVRTGGRPAAGGLSGFDVVAVLEAADRSMALGREVRLDEVAPDHVIDLTSRDTEPTLTLRTTKAAS